MAVKVSEKTYDSLKKATSEGCQAFMTKAFRGNAPSFTTAKGHFTDLVEKTECFNCVDAKVITQKITLPQGTYTYGFACTCDVEHKIKALSITTLSETIWCKLGGLNGASCQLTEKHNNCYHVKCPKFDPTYNPERDIYNQLV